MDDAGMGLWRQIVSRGSVADLVVIARAGDMGDEGNAGYTEDLEVLRTIKGEPAAHVVLKRSRNFVQYVLSHKNRTGVEDLSPGTVGLYCLWKRGDAYEALGTEAQPNNPQSEAAHGWQYVQPAHLTVDQWNLPPREDYTQALLDLFMVHLKTLPNPRRLDDLVSCTPAGATRTDHMLAFYSWLSNDLPAKYQAKDFAEKMHCEQIQIDCGMQKFSADFASRLNIPISPFQMPLRLSTEVRADLVAHGNANLAANVLRRRITYAGDFAIMARAMRTRLGETWVEDEIEKFVGRELPSQSVLFGRVQRPLLDMLINEVPLAPLGRDAKMGRMPSRDFDWLKNPSYDLGVVVAKTLPSPGPASGDKSRHIRLEIERSFGQPQPAEIEAIIPNDVSIRPEALRPGARALWRIVKPGTRPLEVGIDDSLRTAAWAPLPADFKLPAGNSAGDFAAMLAALSERDPRFLIPLGQIPFAPGMDHWYVGSQSELMTAMKWSVALTKGMKVRTLADEFLALSILSSHGYVLARERMADIAVAASVAGQPIPIRAIPYTVEGYLRIASRAKPAEAVEAVKWIKMAFGVMGSEGLITRTLLARTGVDPALDAAIAECLERVLNLSQPDLDVPDRIAGIRSVAKVRFDAL